MDEGINFDGLDWSNHPHGLLLGRKLQLTWENIKANGPSAKHHQGATQTWYVYHVAYSDMEVS